MLTYNCKKLEIEQKRVEGRGWFINLTAKELLHAAPTLPRPHMFSKTPPEAVNAPERGFIRFLMKLHSRDIKTDCRAFKRDYTKTEKSATILVEGGRFCFGGRRSKKQKRFGVHGRMELRG